METAVATSAQDLPAPFALRDVEDLHDADFDGVLADAFVDAGVAVASDVRWPASSVVGPRGTPSSRTP